MGLKLISLKIPEELLEEIQREAERKLVSFSEMIRQRMGPSGSQTTVPSQLMARIDQLEQQVSVIGKEIAKMAAAQESLTPLIAATHSINESLSRLVELLNEEQPWPASLSPGEPSETRRRRGSHTRRKPGVAPSRSKEVINEL